MSTGKSDVVVIGGGIVGLASALAAISLGRTVTLIDPAPGTGASHAAAGMLSPGAELLSGEVHAARDAQNSLQAWPEFAQTARIDAPTMSGSLLVGWSGGDRREIDRLTSVARDYEIQSEMVGRNSSQHFSAISPRINEGVFFPSDSYVNVDRVIDGLINTLRSAQVQFLAAEALSVEDSKTMVTNTTEGLTESDFVVIATGFTSKLAQDMNPHATAVRPVRGVTLRLQRRDGGQSRMTRALVDGRLVYIVERPDGSVVIGASSEESGDRYVDTLAVSELLRLSLLVQPSLDVAEFVEARSGLRPVAAEGVPFFEMISSRCAWTSGYYRHGVLMAPLAFARIREVLA